MGKIILPHEIFVKNHYRRERIVVNSKGQRVKVYVDDSDTVTQIESDDQLDAIVRPKTIRIKFRRDDS